MFRTLGLRHLPVVDSNHRLVGIITRECFMDTYKPLRSEEGYVNVEPPTPDRLSPHGSMHFEPMAGTPLLGASDA
jgi:hypothetical protein